MKTPASPILVLKGITKKYSSTTVLDEVSIEINRGEVHALIGENGAGKSTLCKIISGVVQPDGGQLMFDGEPVFLSGPADGLQHGVAMVYQETSLIPTMTVAQNIQLGREQLFNPPRRINAAASNLLQSMAFHVDASAYVSTLGSAKKQMVEIARALRIDASIMIFDEPTATLTPEEKRQLFDVIDALRAAGTAVVFVSHAIEEALAISDRVTVLRDGKLQMSSSTEGLTRADLVSKMVGRDVEYGIRTSRTDHQLGRKVLSVENVTMGTMVKNMSFSVYAGEITGIAGLVGSGRSEIAQIIAGRFKRDRINGGRIVVNGKAVRYRVPKQAMDDGITYITEDRKVNGYFETLTAEDNVVIGLLARRRPPLVRRGAKMIAKQILEVFDVRGKLDGPVISFSGGNQQKVVIAKSLVQKPEIVIFDEPTRGVDVGAIEAIHELIRKLADDGKAVIVISSYLPEVRALSDRILVARGGRIAAEFSPEDATEERIMFAAVH